MWETSYREIIKQHTFPVITEKPMTLRSQNEANIVSQI